MTDVCGAQWATLKVRKERGARSRCLKDPGKRFRCSQK